MPRGQSIGQELLDVPFPQMIRSMGLAIAEAQFALDETSLRLAQMMSGRYEVEEVDPITGDVKVSEREALVTFNGEELSLIELGFTPSFYQFVDTIIEVKISISITRESSYSKETRTKTTKAFGGGFLFFGGGSVRSTSVNARYASKYQYSAEGSSLLRTKLVPVPPPAILEERIRKVIEAKENED